MTVTHRDPNLTDTHQYLLRWSRSGRLQQALRGDGGHMTWMDVPSEEAVPGDPYQERRAERVREHNALSHGFGVTPNSAQIVSHTLNLLREALEHPHDPHLQSRLFGIHTALDQVLLAVFHDVLPVGEGGQRRWPVAGLSGGGAVMPA